MDDKTRFDQLMELPRPTVSGERVSLDSQGPFEQIRVLALRAIATLEELDSLERKLALIGSLGEIINLCERQRDGSIEEEVER